MHSIRSVPFSEIAKGGEHGSVDYSLRKELPCGQR